LERRINYKQEIRKDGSNLEIQKGERALNKNKFIQVGNGTYNVKYIHSITMNKDGNQGWMILVNKSKENGYQNIRLSPEEYLRIEEILLTLDYQYTLLKERVHTKES